MKAIQVKDSQACVNDERCIACGTCLLVCPQEAKEIVSDRLAVENMLQGKAPVCVSIAPALAAAWPGASLGQVITALKRLGFAQVSQTSAGAAVVSAAYQKLLDRGRIHANPLLTTACPAIVNLVERYYPDLVPFLAPVASPLLVHARMLKAYYPGAQVVFIGPCLAKKEEAARPENAGLIDGVLLYSEIRAWFEEAGIDPATLPASPWSELDQELAALYPTAGGLLRYLDGKGQLLLEANGLEQVRDLLEAMREGGLKASLVECNACAGGCLDGPGMPREESLFQRKERLINFQTSLATREQKRGQLPTVPTTCDYRPQPIKVTPHSEKEILQVLSKIGKTTPEAELNCGACGYSTCREKAAAVLDGMAELDMCIPYMRSRAESLANLVMQATANAIIIVDKDLIIQDFNPAAERMFVRQASKVIGLPIGRVIPDEDFRLVRDSGKWVIGKRVIYPNLGLVTMQTINPLQSGDLILGVISDVTKFEMQERALSQVRAEPLEKAQEVINKQMRVAQEIAGLLGEVTADSKMLLLKLIKLVQGEEDDR
ncbi:MAG: PAS domain-containing protein [Firmicutes bacterium]|nr:PAS domain-containing protein [Bacillota bacterium]